jgi:RimJ/RimL family protein N-acetyltransferase
MLRPEFPIVTERLLLRPFLEEDADALAAIHAHPSVVRYLYTDVMTAEDALDAVRHRSGATSLEAEGDQFGVAMILADDGAFIGDVSLVYRSEQNGLAEIGFVTDPAHRGRGLATEAARAVLDLAFESLDLHRVIGRCDARNLASARLLARLGLRQEAHFVENEFVKGEWTDELVFAILRSEWSAGRRAAGEP